MSLKMTIEQLQALLGTEFPQVHDRYVISELSPNRAVLRMPVSDTDLRPGGTVSGPSMFGLADVAFYVATMAMIGPQTLSVTTSCSINFMRKPAGHGVIRAEARILKLGRTLSVGDVMVYSDGIAAPVAHATLTYAIPPR